MEPQHTATARWAAFTTPVTLEVMTGAAAMGNVECAFFNVPGAASVVVGLGAAQSQVAHEAQDAMRLLEELCSPNAYAVRGPMFPRPWLGGMAFDWGAKRQGWEGFPLTRWVLPRWQVWQQNGNTFLTAWRARSNADKSPWPPPWAELEVDALEGAQRCLQAAQGVTSALRQHVEHLFEDQPAWNTLMAKALAALGQGALSKVVLARAVDVGLARPPNAMEILTQLAQRFPSCLAYLVRGSGGETLVGATPETLCRLQGQELRVDALAGSAAPGMGAALLASAKDQAEHAVVVHAVTAALTALGAQVSHAGTPTVMELPNVCHLHTPVTALLPPHLGLSAVVAALHPTPAVGGWPKKAALDFIAAHEDHPRGWYAGAVGQLGPGSAHLGVALRCALLNGKAARLMVGAGVVAGSTAQGEWEETGRKSQALLSVLGGYGQ